MINKKYRKVVISCLCLLTLFLSACTNSPTISNTESEIYVQQEVITSEYIKKEIAVPDDTDKQYFNETACKNLFSERDEPLYIFPANYDSELAFQKGLANKKGDFNDLYFEIQALYRASFETYIVQNMDFEEICAQLDDTGFKNVILDVPKENQDYYSKYSNFIYPYISIWNNIYIERLDIYDIEKLAQIVQNQGVVVTSGSMEIVENSWSEIIAGNYKTDLPIGSLYFEIFIPYDFNKDISGVDTLIFDEYLPWLEKQKLNFTDLPIGANVNMILYTH